METERIEQSLVQYRKIAHLSEAIEQALHSRDLDELPLLCGTMDELQETSKANDSAILALVRHRHDLRESAQMQELLTLMQVIQERNQRLTPQIIGIMAVQRNELQKLNKGNTLLQGYRPSTTQTGNRFSSAG